MTRAAIPLHLHGLRDAVAEELKRRFSYKLQSTCILEAKGIVEGAERAALSYDLGAAGALIDVLWLYDCCKIELPSEIAAERDDVLADGLRGRGQSAGQGARPPLDAHNMALRRRLRWHAVTNVLGSATRYAEEREEARKNRFGEEWWKDHATWPEVSDKITRACEIALDRLGDKTVTVSAIYQDFRVVDRDIAFCRYGWVKPSIYYVPTEEACEWLGLDFGLRLLRDGWTGTDGPRWPTR